MYKLPIFKPQYLCCTAILIFLSSYQVWSADCYTTANNTWSCGTPSPSDNLFISHQVTITGDLTTTGNITISGGGNLTITGKLEANNNEIIIEDGVLNVNGNVELTANCSLTVYGSFNTENSLFVRSGASFLLKGGTVVNGSITVDTGSKFVVKKASDLLITGNFTNNANATEVDGVLTIMQSFINNSLITGVGEISFDTCLGSGTVNNLNPATYCSSSPIDLLSSHCSASDFEPPKFTSFPSDITDYAIADECGAFISWSTPGVSDNCSIDELIPTHKPGDLFPIGATDVTYTVTDKAGNSAKQTFTITISDTISPVITGLPNLISIDAELSTCGASVNWVEPTITDNCSVIISSDYNSGDFFPIGNYTVTYTATDPSGNISKRSFDVEVTNPHQPVFVTCPTDTVLYTGKENCEVIVNWDEPVTEGCGITITQSHKPGDVFAIGAHDVVYTATDVSGNTTSCTFNIQVLDTIAPEFIFCPSTFEIISVDTLNEQSVISWDEPQVEDFCSSITMSSDHQPGDSFDFGVTSVTYSAIDDFGNEAFCTFEVQSGINNPPVVESQSLSVQAGEAIDICLRANDPDGDRVRIHTIRTSENGASISEVDSIALCFVYTASEQFEGTDTVIVQVVDSGIPNMYATAEIVIKVEREHTLVPSSAITPNGDEINDIWKVQNIDLYPDNTVQIFDRWGGLIYQNTAYDNVSIVWDGKNEGGRLVSSGTYFYVIVLGSGDEKITGPIEVIE